MFHPIRSLVALAVIVGLLVGADRVAAHAAEGRIAQAVQSAADLPSRPTVRVHGFPFVTQAIRGTYDHIEVTANDIFGRADAGRGSVTTVSFEGVHIPASKALSGKVHEIQVDHVTGQVEVAFADIETAAHLPGVTVRAIAGHDNEVSIDEAISFAGATVNASAIASVALAGNTLTLKVVDVQIAGGITVPASVLAGLRTHASFSVKIPGLPAGVKLTAVVVSPDGVIAALQATALTLTR
jgi:hypothetical protein